MRKLGKMRREYGMGDRKQRRENKKRKCEGKEVRKEKIGEENGKIRKKSKLER